jgi:hypothetical protein
MTRNGKIARLPKTIRDELNRRLDNNEQGKGLVAWLNSLPEVYAIIKSDFGGKPIREQNLSEWKKGGYADWQKRQEILGWLNQLKEDAAEVDTVMRNSEFTRNLAMVLSVDLARAMKEAMEQIPDPGKRMDCLERMAGRIAQFRREESNAARAQIASEKWQREVAAKEKLKKSNWTTGPVHALLLQRLYIENYADPAIKALLPEADPAESDPIRPASNKN